MAWLICGTVPDETFPLVQGVWNWNASASGCLTGPDGRTLSVQRGTPALMAAAWLTCHTLNAPQPEALLVGDTGKGDGSRALYRFLAAQTDMPYVGLTFHYLFPDLDGHAQVLMAVQALPSPPLLIADAGFMYVAKMSGYADAYDLFTPDIGELAFLADETAPHPFYTRGFLLAEEDDAPELIRRAYAHGNCARNLLVKGRIDRVVAGGTTVQEIAAPNVPNMEPIGGTGDLVTGLVTGLLASGMPLLTACILAARTNRVIGSLTTPTPATQVAELLPALPEALRFCLRESA